MANVSIELAARLVDVAPDPYEFVCARVIVHNSTGLMAVSNVDSTPRSLHRFSANPRTFGGYDRDPSFANRCRMLLGVAGTMANDRVLFGPAQLSELHFVHERDPLPRRVEPVEGQPGVTRTEITVVTDAAIAYVHEANVELDESVVLGTIAKLSALDVFSLARSGDLRTQNLGEAIRNYWEAIQSPTLATLYASLFQSLEKASNADGKNRVGDEFNARAARAAGVDETDVEELRMFNNRVKHSLRHDRDRQALHDGEGQLPYFARRLKGITDSVLRSRL